MDLKLSLNVLEEIHKYGDKKFKEQCPTFIVKVKKIERDKGRYWAVLLDGTEKEIWAMFTKSIAQKIPIQDLIIEPAIKIIHYYLHKFEAKLFIENPPETYINVMGISEIEVLTAKALKKIELKNAKSIIGLVPLRKLQKRKFISISPVESKFEDLPNPPKETSKPVQPVAIVEPTSASSEKRYSESECKPSSPKKLKNDIHILDQHIKTVNRNHNVKTTSSCESENENDSLPEVLVGSRREVVPLTSLKETKIMPLVRVKIDNFTNIKKSSNNFDFVRCDLSDSSGTMFCIIFDPVCNSIYGSLQVGAVMEIEKAKLTKSTLDLKQIIINNWAIVRIYKDGTCIYRYPSNTVTTKSVKALPQSTASPKRYLMLETISLTFKHDVLVDVIGVVVWASGILNNPIKCKQLRIQDESVSAKISAWKEMADTLNFPIGSIILCHNIRLLIYGDYFEFSVESKSKISFAADCEEKRRLQKWYRSIRGNFNSAAHK